MMRYCSCSATYLTGGARSIRRGNVRTDCGRLGLLAAGASSAAHPSCSPSYHRDCRLRWDLHGVKTLLVVLDAVLQLRGLGVYSLHQCHEFFFLSKRFESKPISAAK